MTKRYRHKLSRLKSRRWLATHGWIVKPDGRRFPVKVRRWRHQRKPLPIGPAVDGEVYDLEFSCDPSALAAVAEGFQQAFFEAERERRDGAT